jgi:hypothetical protein
MHKGMGVEAIELSSEGLRGADEGTDLLRQVKVWFTQAIHAAELTDPDGVDYGRSGLAIAHRLGDPNAIGRMELALGAAIRHATTDPEYLQHLHEARRLLEAHPEPAWWESTWDHGLNQLLLSAYLPMSDERVAEHGQAALEVFDQVGDVAMLAATLNDRAGSLYVAGERERALASSRRACDMLAEIDSPNWYGHALMLNGTLLALEAEPAPAIGRLAEAARLLDMVGDVNCWSASSRAVARCETALGKTTDAAGRLLAVLDRMPTMPIPEITKPRTLDAIAELVLATGRSQDGGRLVGAALAAPFDPEAVMRPRELADIRAKAVEALGEEEAERLLAEGASMDVDMALESGRRILDEMVGVASDARVG